MFDISKFDVYKEDNRREVKKSKGGLPLSLWETYSAFANCSGGVIILGASEKDDGSWEATGLLQEDKLRKEFWDTINNRNKVSINLLTDHNLTTYEISGKTIMVITVPPAVRELKPVYINGDMFKGTFRRNWEGDYRCTPNEIKAMLRDQTEQTMDMKILENWFIDDLNQESVQAYRNLHRSWKPGHVWEMLGNKDYLKNIGAAAISNLDGKLHPTAAGMLMFGNEYNIVREFPEYFLDYREMLDPTIRWTDRLQSSSGEWSGNVFDFYFRVYNKIIKDVKIPFKIEGGIRIDDTTVHRALREALANCLVNADFYVSRGVVIKKDLNSLILENPGYIRTGKEQMRKGGESDPRNKALMKMFNLINIGERAGSGVPDIFKTWEQEGWVDPVIEERYGDASRTILRLSFTNKQAKKTSEINKRNKTSEIKQTKKTQIHKEKILAFIENNGASKTSEIADLLGLSEARTRAILKEMVVLKVLKTKGTTKKKVYYKPK